VAFTTGATDSNDSTISNLAESRGYFGRLRPVSESWCAEAHLDFSVHRCRIKASGLCLSAHPGTPMRVCCRVCHIRNARYIATLCDRSGARCVLAIIYRSGTVYRVAKS